MRFADLLSAAGDEPVFETGLLLVGSADPADVCRQLVRWARAGRVYRLRRGLWSLAPPYQKVKPHPFLVANRLVRPSYVSGASALAHWGLIPEGVPVVTSVTTGRPGLRSCPLGRYEFRHVATPYFEGFSRIDLGGGQEAILATPEKALLDLVHLTPGGERETVLGELRLQHLERLDLAALSGRAEKLGSQKLRRAASAVERMAREEIGAYEPL